MTSATPCKHYTICLLPGDGIGPEIVRAGQQVMEALSKTHGFGLTWKEALLGGVAYEATGNPCPEATLETAKTCDAILLGAVGDPKFDGADVPATLRPERGLLAIRKALGLYANIRPLKLYAQLGYLSPLKQDRLEGVDFVMIRELTGGVYFGKPQEKSYEEALDTLRYTREEIERIVRLGFETAQRRPRKHLTSVDKANVLYSSQLWREVVETLAPEYPEVTVQHLYVDNTAMQLILNPKQFDVIVTENMFGDILSDEAAVLAGSLGMLPSASLSMHPGLPSLYEPIHGSAPSLAGKDSANPVATLLSVAMMLEYSLKEHAAAQALTEAIGQVLASGHLTADLLPAESNASPIGTQAFTDAVCETLLSTLTLVG
ncbi:MAG: 3-isopropylmalate dehydrogenase [Vampirovibrionales bacterium]